MRYIWLVNRCLRGTTIGVRNQLRATLNPKVNLFALRRHEPDILARVVQLVRSPNRTFTYQDFRRTTRTATRDDVVFLDCPFPVFSRMIPKTPGHLLSVASNVYGLDGDDSLQRHILDEIKRLAALGTTLLVCNFANPDLVLAYSQVLREQGIDSPQQFIYTYKSPGNESSIYQLAVIPGHGASTILPTLISGLAVALSGNNHFFN